MGKYIISFFYDLEIFDIVYECFINRKMYIKCISVLLFRINTYLFISTIIYGIAHAVVGYVFIW